MKIAIAGAGIAGGYLAALLAEKGISPDIYGGTDPPTRCGCRSCGWGVPREIQFPLAQVGLDLNDYLLGSMPRVNFDGIIARTPLCTLDKPRLVRDLTRHLPVRREPLDPEAAEAYDLVIDATGIVRAFLPPCRSDLILPTLQHRVTVTHGGNGMLQAGIYGGRVPGLGYLWIFPLGDDQYHIGIGGIGLVRHESLLAQFYAEESRHHSFTRLCGCLGAVRVASPWYAAPLYQKRMRRDGTPQLVIGVGEAIGTVAPFTGEGIRYALQCARMLVDASLDPEIYARSVLTRFEWMKKERETLDYLLSPQGRKGPRWRDRWRFYQNAHRSGIELPLWEAFKRMGSLSQWVHRTGNG